MRPTQYRFRFNFKDCTLCRGCRSCAASHRNTSDRPLTGFRSMRTTHALGSTYQWCKNVREELVLPSGHNETISSHHPLDSSRRHLLFPPPPETARGILRRHGTARHRVRSVRDFSSVAEMHNGKWPTCEYSSTVSAYKTHLL